MNASIFGWPVRVVGRRPSPRCGGLHQRLMRPLPRPRRWNGPRPLKEVLTMNGLPPIRLEGIRTLDLLHGKQNVQRRVGPEYACEPEVFAAARSARASRLSPGNHGGLGTQWVASYRDSGRPARWTATSWSGQAPVRTRSYKLSGARSAPPGQTTVPVSRSTVTSAKPSGCAPGRPPVDASC